jgi:multiple sugar transport system substrate-binding protein
MLALVMVIALLAACGNNANNAGVKNEGAGNANQDVTIKFYNWDPDQDAINTIIADFEAENPGIKVSSEVLVPGGSADDNLTKLDVLMATGEDVDVVAIPNQEYTVLRAANNMFLPLTDYFAQDGVNVDEDYLTNVKYDEEVYAVPQFVNQWYVLLNKDHLDEAGLQVPQVGWTWDEYKEYAKKMTKGEGPSKQYGTYFHTWGEFANPMLYTEKPHPYMINETTSIFDDSSFDYWFDLRRAMEKEDKSVKTYSDVIGSKLNYRTEFFNEQASMIFIGSWTIADIGNIESYPHDFKTAFAPMPRMNEQSPIGGTNVAGEFLALSKSTDHPEEAYKFLRYLSTKGSEKRGAISGWKDANSEAFISSMLEKNPDLYDEASLKHTLFNEHVHSAATGEINIAYGTEMKGGVLEAGFAKFILDNTSAADAKAYMVKEANKVIKQNQ